MKCVQCKSTACILSKVLDGNSKKERYRLRCLDCNVAWWQDEHGGDISEYQPRREW